MQSQTLRIPALPNEGGVDISFQEGLLSTLIFLIIISLSQDVYLYIYIYIFRTC